MMGKVDTAASILELAQVETLPEILQDKLEIPHRVLQEHLKMLESKGLIDVSKANIVTTKRGTKFLELYKSIHQKYLTVPA
jgi:predicted transcriptional regulator